MIYWAFIFFFISVATAFAGINQVGGISQEDAYLMASAYLVLSVFFFALRYWEKKSPHNFFDGSESYI